MPFPLLIQIVLLLFPSLNRTPTSPIVFDLDPGIEIAVMVVSKPIISGLRRKFQLEATLFDFRCGILGRELDMGRILMYNIRFAWLTIRQVITPSPFNLLSIKVKACPTASHLASVNDDPSQKFLR